MKASEIKLGDLISIIGFVFSIIVMIFGWAGISEQTRTNESEQETRDLQVQVAEDQKTLASNLETLNSQQRLHDIALVAPTRDAYVIGDHVDFAWSYSGHTERLTYILEIINRSAATNARREETPPVCRERAFTSACHHVAVDPIGERTQLSSLVPGSYLWRVIAVRRDSFPVSWNEFENAVSGWSEYSAFTIYSSPGDRMITEGIRVGALYSQANQFVRLTSGGKLSGYDIDLLKFLIEHCFSVENKKLITIDRTACSTSNTSTPIPENSLKIHFVPILDVGQGFSALREKQIDVFAGSLTRLRSRERGGVRFTDGYYRFETQLFVREAPGHGIASVQDWTERRQTIGVIRGSSNHQFASLLLNEKKLRNRVSLITYETWPELESAFESGDVQGILVDDVLAPRRGWVALSGLKDFQASKDYRFSEDSLGYPKEEFAFAVSVGSMVAGDPAATFFDDLTEALALTPQPQIDLQDFNSLKRQTPDSAWAKYVARHWSFFRHLPLNL